MRRFRQGLAAALLAGTAAIALAGDVVVLKGGTVVALKAPWVQRGNTAYLTRADGTLLSVPVSEIDRDATATARAGAAPRPVVEERLAPATPADAARVNHEGPKARVRITDSDVSHPMDLSAAAVAAEDKKALLAGGGAKVELVTYNQQKDGTGVVVSGQLRNPTQALAENVKLYVTVLDEKGQPINAGNASLSNGEIESGSTVDFNVKLEVGERIPATLRFAPTWTGPKPTPVAPSSPRPGGQRASAGNPTRPSTP